jgi:hypothetical protein
MCSKTIGSTSVPAICDNSGWGNKLEFGTGNQEPTIETRFGRDAIFFGTDDKAWARGSLPGTGKGTAVMIWEVLEGQDPNGMYFTTEVEDRASEAGRMTMQVSGGTFRTAFGDNNNITWNCNSGQAPRVGINVMAIVVDRDVDKIWAYINGVMVEDRYAGSAQPASVVNDGFLLGNQPPSSVSTQTAGPNAYFFNGALFNWAMTKEEIEQIASFMWRNPCGDAADGGVIR